MEEYLLRKLGIDFGSKYIGLAVSDRSNTIAQSKEVIKRTDLKNDLKIFKEYIEDYDINEIVVGMPTSLDGTRGPRADKTQEFINFLNSDWFSSIAEHKFDCIVSNPPYIEEQDPHLKLGDVRFEPISALTSGQDGLDDISLIVDKAWHHLNPNGWLVIEHGYNQSVVVSELLARKGYHKIQVARDLGDNPRVSLAQKPA